MTIHIKVGSHCRSDQLDLPDPLNFPIEPDQARLKGVYTTYSRPLVDYRHSIIPTYTRALRGQLDLCSVAIGMLLDQFDLLLEQ